MPRSNMGKQLPNKQRNHTTNIDQSTTTGNYYTDLQRGIQHR